MSAQAYRYRGYDSRGDRVDGEIVANSTEEAERRVAARDIVVVSLSVAAKGVQEKTSTDTQRRKGRRTSDGEAAAILRNLTVMLEAGVPFVEALDGVAAGARPAEAARLEVLKSEIVSGKSVSRGMRAVPDLFPPLVADVVRVAEEGGRLDRALASAASYLERAHEFRKKVITAMLYPAVMVGVSVITVAILVVFVMPRFADIFVKMKVDLPWTTKTLLAIGDAIRTRPMFVFGGVISVIVGTKVAWRFPVAKRGIALMVRRVPLLGDLIRRVAVSRAFSSIATLLGANVSMMAALEQGAAVSGDPLIYETLMAARVAVERGGSLYDALSASGTIPRPFLQMIAVGERTGRLPSLLSAGATQMEEEVDAKMKAAVSLLEPLMIVLMGAIVGTITVSIISPIYSVIEHIK